MQPHWQDGIKSDASATQSIWAESVDNGSDIWEQLLSSSHPRTDCVPGGCWDQRERVARWRGGGCRQGP